MKEMNEKKKRIYKIKRKYFIASNVQQFESRIDIEKYLTLMGKGKDQEIIFGELESIEVQQRIKIKKT